MAGETDKPIGLFRKTINKLKGAKEVSQRAYNYTSNLDSGKDTKSIFRKTLETPLSPFYILFKWIFYIFSLVLGFGLAVVILLTIFNFLTGGGLSILGTETSIFASETAGPFSKIVTPVRNFVSDPVGTVAEFGSFKNPQTVEKRKPQGIEFRNFDTKKKIHRETDSIETIANVKIYALEDSSTEVDFSCVKTDPTDATTFEEKQGQVKLFGQEEGQSTIFIPEKQDKQLNVECKFDSVSITSLPFKDSKTISEKITLKANYKDFVVNTRLKTYTLDKTVYLNLQNDNVNPFSHFKINDPLISSDRSVRSEQLKSGPATLALNLLDQQPLTEETKYLLDIQLKANKVTWNGKISKLKSLKLVFPNGLAPDIEGCKDFSANGNSLYLKEEILGKLSNEKDIDNQKFYCEFSIEPSAVSEDLSFSLINAEAVFDFTFEAYISALISQNLISSTQP